MKISNSDIIRLAEIKSYFLDPPYTFRIYSYAKPQVDEAINIVKKYNVSPVLLTQMEDLRQLFEQSENDANATRENMRSFAILLNRINR
ncbi:hypothetical protein [Chitinophaga rhizophila]|uniref:Uncharacterized protein n=1 Tax=Chitinophaga rhizophila TaxID=2866212 RepID=A0ABS7G7T3_9BACT|nr:hypothetical protein [Chitinophaga rhizophila]MBW8682787.1 hypothetical protein [Chitinophaga rhizophila]